MGVFIRDPDGNLHEVPEGKTPNQYIQELRRARGEGVNASFPLSDVLTRLSSGIFGQGQQDLGGIVNWQRSAQQSAARNKVAADQDFQRRLQAFTSHPSFGGIADLAKGYANYYTGEAPRSPETDRQADEIFNRTSLPADLGDSLLRRGREVSQRERQRLSPETVRRLDREWAANQNIDSGAGNASDWIDAISAGPGNALESVPSSLAMAGVGIATGQPWLAAGTEGAQAGAETFTEVRDTIRSDAARDPAAFRNSALGRKYLRIHGGNMALAVEDAANDGARTAASVSAISTTVLARIIGQQESLYGVEARKKLAREVLNRPLWEILQQAVKKGLRGSVDESVEEGSQGAAQRLAANVQEREAGSDRPLTQGIAQDARQGAIAAAFMGGPMSAVSHVGIANQAQGDYNKEMIRRTISGAVGITPEQYTAEADGGYGYTPPPLVAPADGGGQPPEQPVEQPQPPSRPFAPPPSAQVDGLAIEEMRRRLAERIATFGGELPEGVDPTDPDTVPVYAENLPEEVPGETRSYSVAPIYAGSISSGFDPTEGDGADVLDTLLKTSAEMNAGDVRRSGAYQTLERVLTDERLTGGERGYQFYPFPTQEGEPQGYGVRVERTLPDGSTEVSYYDPGDTSTPEDAQRIVDQLSGQTAQQQEETVPTAPETQPAEERPKPPRGRVIEPEPVEKPLDPGDVRKALLTIGETVQKLAAQLEEDTGRKAKRATVSVLANNYTPDEIATAVEAIRQGGPEESSPEEIRRRLRNILGREPATRPALEPPPTPAPEEEEPPTPPVAAKSKPKGFTLPKGKGLVKPEAKKPSRIKEAKVPETATPEEVADLIAKGSLDEQPPQATAEQAPPPEEALTPEEIERFRTVSKMDTDTDAQDAAFKKAVADLRASLSPKKIEELAKHVNPKTDEPYTLSELKRPAKTSPTQTKVAGEKATPTAQKKAARTELEPEPVAAQEEAPEALAEKELKKKKPKKKQTPEEAARAETIREKVRARWDKEADRLLETYDEAGAIREAGNIAITRSQRSRDASKAEKVIKDALVSAIKRRVKARQKPTELKAVVSESLAADAAKDAEYKKFRKYESALRKMVREHGLAGEVSSFLVEEMDGAGGGYFPDSRTLRISLSAAAYGNTSEKDIAQEIIGLTAHELLHAMVRLRAVNPAIWAKLLSHVETAKITKEDMRGSMSELYSVGSTWLDAAKAIYQGPGGAYNSQKIAADGLGRYMNLLTSAQEAEVSKRAPGKTKAQAVSDILVREEAVAEFLRSQANRFYAGKALNNYAERALRKLVFILQQTALRIRAALGNNEARLKADAQEIAQKIRSGEIARKSKVVDHAKGNLPLYAPGPAPAERGKTDYGKASAMRVLRAAKEIADENGGSLPRGYASRIAEKIGVGYSQLSLRKMLSYARRGQYGAEAKALVASFGAARSGSDNVVAAQIMDAMERVYEKSGGKIVPGPKMLARETGRSKAVVGSTLTKIKDPDKYGPGFLDAHERYRALHEKIGDAPSLRAVAAYGGDLDSMGAFSAAERAFNHLVNTHEQKSQPDLSYDERLKRMPDRTVGEWIKAIQKAGSKLRTAPKKVELEYLLSRENVASMFPAWPEDAPLSAASVRMIIQTHRVRLRILAKEAAAGTPAARKLKHGPYTVSRANMGASGMGRLPQLPGEIGYQESWHLQPGTPGWDYAGGHIAIDGDMETFGAAGYGRFSVRTVKLGDQDLEGVFAENLQSDAAQAAYLTKDGANDYLINPNAPKFARDPDDMARVMIGRLAVIAATNGLDAIIIPTSDTVERIQDNIGTEWRNAYYDKVLPTAARRFLNGLGIEKVEVEDGVVEHEDIGPLDLSDPNVTGAISRSIKVAKKHGITLPASDAEEIRAVIHQLDRKADEYALSDTDSAFEVIAAVDQLKSVLSFAPRQIVKKKSPVRVIRISREMRMALLKEGFPLWAITPEAPKTAEAQEKGYRGDPADTGEASRWVKLWEDARQSYLDGAPLELFTPEGRKAAMLDMSEPEAREELRELERQIRAKKLEIEQAENAVDVGEPEQKVDAPTSGKIGDIVRAYDHPTLGRLLLPRGGKKWGLLHIKDKHWGVDKPDFNAIQNAKEVRRTPGGKYIDLLDKKTGTYVVVATDYAGQKVNWIVTAYKMVGAEGVEPSSMKDISLPPSTGGRAEEQSTQQGGENKSADDLSQMQARATALQKAIRGSDRRGLARIFADAYMSQPERYARLRKMGFDTSRIFYHGTEASFGSFRPSHGGAMGPGIYLTKNNDAAGAWATEEGGNIIPVFTRGEYSESDYETSDSEFGFDSYDARIVLSPANIRSIHAAADLRYADHPGMLYAMPPRTSPMPGTYSALERAISSSKTGRASAQQWEATLARTPGLKKEEIEWTGVREWLDAHEGAVSRDDLLSFVRANGVRVEETVLGENTENKARLDEIAAQLLPLIEERDRLELERRGLERQARGTIPKGDSLSRWNDIRARTATIREQMAPLTEERDRLSENNQTKWGQFTLPGGSDYRELLLRLPDSATSRARAIEDTETMRQFLERHWSRLKQASSDELMDVLEAEMPPVSGLYAGEIADIISSANDVTGALERLREPIAEDTGRDRYTSPHWSEPNVLAHVRFKERVGPNGERVLGLEEMQSDPLQRLRKLEEIRKTRALSPKEQHEYDLIQSVFPFKNNAWASLAMKRVIRWAAENGFDAIAWVPGDVVNERFSLENHVQSISYQKRGELYEIAWEGKNGNSGIASHGATAEQLPEIVGREIADKIIAGEGRARGLGEARVYDIDGLDLKVGGQGNRAFYDRILVNIANDLGKKYGARVGETRVLTDANPDSMREAERNRRQTLHSLPITRELRMAALNNDLPLFAKTTRGRRTPGYMPPGGEFGSPTDVPGGPAIPTIPGYRDMIEYAKDQVAKIPTQRILGVDVKKDTSLSKKSLTVGGLYDYIDHQGEAVLRALWTRGFAALPWLERLIKGYVPMGNAPDLQTLRIMRSLAAGSQGKAQDLAARLADAVSKAGRVSKDDALKIISGQATGAEIRREIADDMEHIRSYLTHAEPEAESYFLSQISNDELRSVAKEVKDVIDGVGQMLVDSQFLHERQYNKWRRRYLRQMYMLYFESYKVPGGLGMSGVTFGRMRKMLPDDKKIELAPIRDLPFLIYYSIELPLADMARAGYLNAIMHYGLDNAASGWVLPESFVSYGGNKMSRFALAQSLEFQRTELQREESELERIGGTKTAGPTAALLKTYIAERKRQIAQIDSILASHPQYLRAVEKDLLPKGYKQIPLEPRRYAELAGAVLRSDIANDIMGSGEVTINATDDEMIKAARQASRGYNSMVKYLWTVANPGTQLRNIYSNMMTLPQSGTNALRILDAIAAVAQHYGSNKPHPAVQAIIDHGGNKQNFTQADVRTFEQFAEKVRQQDVRAQRAKSFTGIWRPIHQAMTASAIVRQALKDTYGSAATFSYQWGDTLFKIAKTIDAMDRGMPTAIAAMEAADWFFDQSAAPSFVKAARNSIWTPFIGWAYHAIGRSAVSLGTAPWRLMYRYETGLLMASLFVMGVLGGGADGDGDGEPDLLGTMAAANAGFFSGKPADASEKKVLSEWLRKQPFLIPLPWRDEHGRHQWMNFGSIDITATAAQLMSGVATGDVENVAMALSATGGPLISVLSVMKYGVDGTGRVIFEPDDPDWKKRQAIAQYLLTAHTPSTFAYYMPPVFTPLGSPGWEAATGTGKTRYGQPTQTPEQLALRAVGLNTYPVDYLSARAVRVKQYQKKIEDINADIKRLRRDKSYTEPARARQMRNLERQLQEVLEEKNRFVSDTASVAALEMQQRQFLEEDRSGE